MLNLGQRAEDDLNAVGIMTAEDLIQVGVEQAFIRLVHGRLQRGISAKNCTAIYLYAIHGAIHDLDWRQIPDDKQQEFKQLTAEMRGSGQL